MPTATLPRLQRKVKTWTGFSGAFSDMNHISASGSGRIRRQSDKEIKEQRVNYDLAR